MLANLRHPLGIRGPSGFGSGSTAENVTDTFSNQVHGKVVFITGASSGIGEAAARAAAKHDATVVLACRNKEAMHTAAEKLGSEFPGSKLHELVCDLSSLESVRTCAKEFKDLGLPHLNVLINNAGVMACPFTLSQDGVELQMATNFNGHFLLTNLLLDSLKQGTSSRVVNVASSAHMLAPKKGIDFENINKEDKYSAWGAYGQSKLANMVHAAELNKKLAEKGLDITAYSLHPGGIQTNLQRHASFVTTALFRLTSFLWKSIPQGAATTLYCAFGDKAEPGHYHADCNVQAPYHKALQDPQLGSSLWEYGAKVTGSDM